MKFLTQWLLVFLTVLNPIFSSAALTDFDRQELPVKNWLAPYNSGFESSKAKWTASGGTFAAVTSGTNLLVGKGSATWDGSSASQTLTSQTITIEKGYYGQNCEAGIVAQVPSGTATHTVQAYDGTNILVSATIVSSTTPRLNTVNFPCPQSGTVALRLVTVASDEPLIAVDDAYLGLARNVGGTQLISEWTSYTPTGSWTTNTTYTGRKRRVGDSAEYDVLVSVSGAPTAAALTINNSSECVTDTTKISGGTVNSSSVFGYGRVYDNGTALYKVAVQYESTTAVRPAIAQDTGSGYIRDGEASVNSTTPMTFASGDNVHLVYRVPCVGWAASTVVMPDAQGWYVDASISGANPSLGTASVTSYTGIENGSLTMTQNTGSAGVQIGCSSTNAPSGLTCSSGNESLSVAFTPPKTGAYRACVTANHYIDSPAGSINVVSTFQIVETATNAQTIIQEGKGKAMSGSVAISGDRREYRSVATCGDFILSAGAQRMLRFMYETEISGTPDSHYIKADGDTVLGQPDVHWTVYPLQDRATAILANSVSSASANGTHFNSSQIGSTGTVTKETGDWVSGSCSVASAVYTCTLVAGAFSTDPACHATIFGETTSYNAVVTSASTSSVVVRTFDTANVAAAAAFGLTCSGPR